MTSRPCERIQSSSVMNGSEPPAEGAVAGSHCPARLVKSRSMNGFCAELHFKVTVSFFGTDSQTFRLPGGTAAARNSPAQTFTLFFFPLPVSLCLEKLSLAKSNIVAHSLFLRPLVTSASPCVFLCFPLEAWKPFHRCVLCCHTNNLNI